MSRMPPDSGARQTTSPSPASLAGRPRGSPTAHAALDWIESTWQKLLSSGPGVIGGTGGSGTRVIARIAASAGMFIGTDLGPALDARCLKPYLTRWVNAFWPYWDRPLPADLSAAMAGGLQAAVVAHCAALAPSSGRSWGWKAPRSIYLLPFLHRQLPNLRFLHLVRDGRDMAFSSIQAALLRHGPTVLDPSDMSRPLAVQAILLWDRVNLRAADYGEERLGAGYLRIRLEDLCRDPVTGVREILDFFSLDGSPDEFAGLVQAPRSIGRFRGEEPRLVGRLEEAAGATLARFGYPPSG
jgi:Sulfotransferase family